MPEAALWTFVHVVAWSTHVGGTLVMELVWRPAQAHLPPSQTAVACQWMGRRYRWLALTALLAAGASGAVRLADADLRSPSAPADPLSWSHGYGRTMIAAVVVWVALLAILGLLAVLAHPALHVRTPADMTDAERQAARQQVRRAITRMDRLLRLELVLALVALALGASLAHGGLL